METIDQAIWNDTIVEERVYRRLLGRFRLWRGHGLVESIRGVRIEQRRGLIASWMCTLADHELCERLLLLDVEEFAREACREYALPEPTICWIRDGSITRVRVAFSEQPFDA